MGPATETPIFAAGVLLGALLLVVGLAVGHWIGSRGAHRIGGDALDHFHLANLLQGLSRWTDGFANDLSEYRETLDQVCQRFRNSDQGSQDQHTVQAILAGLAAANKGLKARLQRAEETLKKQAQEIANYMSEARTDSLTGLPNRRVFDDELTRRVAEWRRYMTPVSLVLIDVDFFKKLNDEYGHPAGDAILRQVSQVLRDTMRESDLVVRLGGEEFAVVLPGSEGEKVSSAAERLRRAVDTHEFRYEGSTLQVTVSCGAAQAVGEETVAALVRRADEALYAAKGAGRNQAHWHDGTRLTSITPNHGPVCGSADPVSAGVSDAGFGAVCQELRQRLLAVVADETPQDSAAS